ncbi:FAD-dependent monooxygenase [Streptomyces morookaense]|uniref:FAD-dependent monooxygenase n=1 Tax=Streptomyces morookaense TaxID=1970 RepID=A0A7Y7B520_STRMO|nr:FAD-dependent monooxygenase [Streptomyces morookaense]NVK79145.1 FAD-dependent monooxygenase [Streptomyces morookaense]GHF28206.1 FAD-dependent oxidoreductase [Streptomyces morookaense]
MTEKTTVAATASAAADDTIEHVPVLVVGGGPVGLSTALFLTRHGIKPLLVERREATSRLPRAPGIQARTLELFRSAGLEREIRALEMGNTRPYFEGGILRTRTLAEIDRAEVVEAPSLDGPDISPVTIMGCGQDRYERVLLEHARDAGATALFRTELVDLEQDAEGVTALLRSLDDGSERRVRADYVVAADGASSPIRRRLGISQHGRGTVFHALSIYFRAPRLEEVMHGRKFILCYATGGPTTMTLSRLHGCDPWAGAALYDPERESPADFTTERCVQVVRDASGVPDLDVEIVATVPWEGAQRVADTFRVGRVFLAGDAGHVHPPAGGFGANTGIHDGHNLAWKLAAVLRGWAHDGLLDSYDAERRPLGSAMAEQALLRNRIRHGLAPDGDQDRMVDDIVVTLGYRYTSSAVAGPAHAAPLLPGLDLSGAPGTRAPHVWLRRGDERISTLDLFSDAFTLLTADRRWCDVGDAVAARTPVPLRSHLVGRDGLVEDGADWAACYGVSRKGAVLVRPDGFVAWRSPDGGEDDPEAALLEVLTRLVS